MACLTHVTKEESSQLSHPVHVVTTGKSVHLSEPISSSLTGMILMIEAKFRISEHNCPKDQAQGDGDIHQLQLSWDLLIPAS